EPPMQYMLLIHMDDTPFMSASELQRTQMIEPYVAYTQALVSSGAMVSGERLKPASMSTVVRVRDDRTEVLDGPFADTKEQLGGFYVIEAPDLDAAIDGPARCPAASRGTIEVRPIWPMDKPA